MGELKTACRLPPIIIKNGREFVAITSASIEDEIRHIASDSLLGIMFNDFEQFCIGMGYEYEIVGKGNKL
jgi:hypothetical protein